MRGVDYEWFMNEEIFFLKEGKVFLKYHQVQYCQANSAHLHQGPWGHLPALPHPKLLVKRLNYCGLGALFTLVLIRCWYPTTSPLPKCPRPTIKVVLGNPVLLTTHPNYHLPLTWCSQARMGFGLTSALPLFLSGTGAWLKCEQWAWTWHFCCVNPMN